MSPLEIVYVLGILLGAGLLIFGDRLRLWGVQRAIARGREPVTRDPREYRLRFIMNVTTVVLGIALLFH